jgi:hypothetical protein
MENLPELLKSKRFWSAVFYVAVLMLTAISEELAAVINVEWLTVVFGILIGGYAVEDFATARNTKPE